jgi:hypothetical protein
MIKIRRKLVAEICNPSYLRGPDQEDGGSNLAQAGCSYGLISTNGHGGVYLSSQATWKADTRPP